MTNGPSPQHLTQSILETLLYYDIFLYPLTSSEVFQYLSTNHVTETEVTERLHRLVDDSVIFRLGKFFSIQNNADLEQRRTLGNKRAAESLVTARKKSKLIASFPFVRAVLISGSLAKGYMDDKSDLDFFIITKPGRLWIARTLLVTYKRIFLFNSHKYFCVNYFIDTDHLEIEEQNRFTATELATLVPMAGSEWYGELIAKNSWIKSFLPNHTTRPISAMLPPNTSVLKRAVERIVDSLFGARLERFFKAKTAQRWERKYRKHYDAADFRIAFKSSNHASKNHPNNYQRKVIELHEQKVRSFVAVKELTKRV